MKKIVLALAITVIGVAAQAQIREATPQQQLVTTCNAEAKNRELKGEDKKKYLSTCFSDGRKRQQEVIMTCNARARGKGGDERKKFMAACLQN